MDSLITFATQVDTLIVTLEAFNQGFISKEDLNTLTSINPEVSMVERRRALLKHVQTYLKEKLLVFSKHNSELEIDTSAVQAHNGNYISIDIYNDLKSLQNSEVPYSMRCRYLLQFVHRSIATKPKTFVNRVLQVEHFEPYQDNPLKFAIDAHQKNLIDKSVLDYFINKCPRGRVKCNFHQEYKSKLKHSVECNFHQEYKSKLKHSVDLEMSELENCAKEVFSFTIPSNIVADSLIDPDQLPKVWNLLVNYAYNWWNIGTALNFRPQDLRNIQAAPLLLQDAPKSYLSRLLEDWLLKKLKHTLPPSVNCLKRALNSQIVGLGSLASEIDRLDLCKSMYQTVFYLSYCSINDESPFHAVYVKEGLSTLLEIQTARHEERTYQWLKDGEKLTSNGSNEPIFYLHQADIDWDGCELSCQVKPATTSTPVITVNVSCELDQYRGNLASTYLFQPEVPEDTWPPVADLKYINLALVQQQKIDYNSKCARLTIRGDMDDILLDKQIVEYNDKDFFKRMSSGKLILIEGRPGSGKTTFVHKLAQDWANKSGGAIRLLLLVSLRVLNTFSNPDLTDILKLFENLKVSKDIIERRYGKGVCFIFDGFDEFSPEDKNSSVVHKIIHKSYLRCSVVIVASRPAALTKLRHKANLVIEVVGFLNEQIMEYFDHYPFSTPTKSKELKLYLESHPNIFHICYLPIHATMIAFVFQEMGKVPTTETDIYTHFTRLTLIRNLTKNREFEPINIDLHSLTGEESVCFKQICQLACEKTLSSEQVLDHNDVNSHFQVKRNIDSTLGLITVDRTAGLYGYKNIYTFMHLTFQEYLAAYHITTLSDEEQMELIQEYGDKNHMLVVWKFYCGLIKITPFDSKFHSLLCKNDNTLFQIQCGYETQKKNACALLLKSVNYHLKFEAEYLSTPDFTAIGYVSNTNTTSTSIKLSLLNCNVNVEAIDALLSEMEDGARGQIHTLHIETAIVDDSQLEGFKKLMVNLKHLRALSLEAKTKLLSLQAKATSCNEASIIELFKLTELVLINVDIGPLLSGSSFANLSRLHIEGGYESLASCLQHCKHLVELDISGNHIDDQIARDLFENCKDWNHLRSINAAENDIKSSGVAAIYESIRHCYLKHNPTLEMPLIEKADLENVKFLAISLDNNNMLHCNIFCRYIRGWQKLNKPDLELLPQISSHHSPEELTIKNCNSSSAVMEKLKSGLEMCPNIQKLHLCNIKIVHGNELLPMIYMKLLSKSSQCLKEIKIVSSRIDDFGVRGLSISLKWFPSLLNLSLPSNSISSQGCVSLAANLDYFSGLERLDLEDNLIDSDGAHEIMYNLKHCKQFRELNLLRNPCHNVIMDQEITFSVELSYGVILQL